jgi:hypothetical protein
VQNQFKLIQYLETQIRGKPRKMGGRPKKQKTSEAASVQATPPFASPATSASSATTSVNVVNAPPSALPLTFTGLASASVLSTTNGQTEVLTEKPQEVNGYDNIRITVYAIKHLWKAQAIQNPERWRPGKVGVDKSLPAVFEKA